MRFWDSSAIVSLLVPEQSSSACFRLLLKDPEVVVWALTPVEVLSAIHRRTRAGQLDHQSYEASQRRLDVLRSGWDEILDVEVVRARAERILAVHELRAADALQLAAALTASAERPRRVELVSLDQRLNEAARREGFTVLPQDTNAST